MPTVAKNDGLFISFEGIEGAGKTTNIHYIAEQIQQAGKKTLLTREPGGTELSEAIRELLISKDLPEMCVNTELLLMFAARSEHIHRVVLPAISEGKWVLCYRFTDATYAYQGAGRGISDKKIALLEGFTQNGLKPNHTFLFDLPAKVGLSRAKSRGETDRFEQQHIDFFNRVRDRYLTMAQSEKKRFHVIDAELELPEVHKQMLIAFKDILSCQ